MVCATPRRANRYRPRHRSRSSGDVAPVQTWTRTDEWYDFRAQPSGVRVLAEVDESTYTGGSMGTHHPIAWTHGVGAGRSVYIAMGHTEESYAESLFREMLLGALRFTSGDAPTP